MKKVILPLLMLAIFTLAIVAVPVKAQTLITPQYNLSGTWSFDDIWNNGNYYHVMIVTSFNPSTGDFSGSGYYVADPGLTWTIVGTETGNSVTFTLTTGGNNPGVVIQGTGTVSSYSYMSGTGTQTNLPNQGPVTWTANRTDTFVAPEYSFGALLALGASIAAFLTFVKIRKR